MSSLVGIILVLGILTFVGPAIRFLVGCVIVWLIVTSFSNSSSTPLTTNSTYTSSYDDTDSKILTYQQLYDYPSDCSKKDEQLKELLELQKLKNFDPDPDNLNPWDRAYNSRLKASIWWYEYRCNQ
jgi:hypothetical protein